MSATVSMWLGIAFVGLGIFATILQAWLWRFPMVPDPGGPDPNGKSTAPRSWTNVHRLAGLAFVVIYVLMMWNMVPRLWEYQVELPSRTVIHAVMGIAIGFLLIVKIAIIRWFQHFGKSLPMIGMAIMLCTIILAVLSMPFAIRAHDFGAATTPENLARVKGLLEPLDLGRPAAELATEDTMAHGRKVLTEKCIVCHDLRTILRRPYAPAGWWDVVERMAEKPQIHRAMVVEDLAPVTAYLVAITPDIQKSLKLKRADDEARLARITPPSDYGGPAADPTEEPAAEPGTQPAATATPAPTSPTGAPQPTTQPTGVPVAAPTESQPSTQPTTLPAVEPVKPTEPPAVPKKPAKKSLLDSPEAVAKAKAVYIKECTACHGLEDVTEVAPQDWAGWRGVVRRMITENDAEIGKADQDLIVAYLVRTHGGKPKPKPAPAGSE